MPKVAQTKPKQPNRLSQKPKGLPKKAIKEMSHSMPSRTKPLTLLYLAWSILWRHRYVFGLILLSYGLVNLAIVEGFSGGLDVASLKHQLASLFGGASAPLLGGLTVYGALLVGAGNTSSTSLSNVVTSIFFILVSLAVIYALRSARNKQPISFKEAYYQGMYPLIPFIGVLLVVSLELLPMVAGVGLFSLVLQQHIATVLWQQAIFLLIMIIGGAISLRWLASSILALYVVALPNMTPIKALRSARELVKGRRLAIVGRLVFLPLTLLIGSFIIMLPIILIVAPAAQWAFRAVALVMIGLAHAYYYSLYRELIDE